MNDLRLVRVQEKDKDILTGLLYEYQKELQVYSGDSLEDIKRYKYLPSYFTNPDRAAFFIHAKGEICGFILVNMHTILAKNAHSVAEFYVVPSARGKGVGENAAKLVFRKFPGNWEVAQMETNIPAIHFWRKTISAFTKGRYVETFVDSDTWRGPVQTFRST